MRFALLLQVVLVTALPVVVATLFRRRYALNLALWWAGALTFVASQIVHLPLNWWLESFDVLGPGRLVIRAVVFGLTAGVCEEVARVFVLRYWRRDARSGVQGLFFAAGHAGSEAILFVGLRAAFALYQLAIIDKIGVDNLGLLPEQSATLANQLRALESAPLWVPLLAFFERCCSLTFHMGATLLCLVAVVRRRPLLVAYAIGWHALGDGVMVYLLGRLGGFAAEGWVLATVPVSFVIGRWAFRQLPSHDEVVPRRVRPVSSGEPVELQSVDKRFGEKVQALKGTTFTLKRGERACLLGPNGAGKTTTIRMLTGALSPSSGFAFLYGAAADEPEFLAAKRRVGIVPQLPGMYKEMSCRDYLAFVRALYDAAPFDEIVTRLELGPFLDRQMSTLSGGWQRRLSLAAALIPKPELLILDEPSAGLDPIASREFIDLLREITETTTTLLCTHNLAEAEQLCDTAVIFRNGRVLVHEAIATLRAKTTPRVSLKVTGDAAPLTAALVARGHEPVSEDGAILVPLAAGESGVPELLRDLLSDGLLVCECRVVRPTLEELFLDIVQEEEA